MKRTRQLVDVLALCSTAWASSRLDPNTVTSATALASADDSTLWEIDGETDWKDTSSTILASNTAPVDEDGDEWWMDPLAIFEDDEHEADPSHAQSAPEDDLFGDDFFFDNDQDGYFNEDKNAESSIMMDEDLIMPEEEPLAAFSDSLHLSQEEEEDEDFGLLENWMAPEASKGYGGDDFLQDLDDLEIDSPSYFAEQDEIDVALPQEEEELAPVEAAPPKPQGKAPVTPSKKPVHRTGTVYDPVSPLPAPANPPQKVGWFSKSPFGLSKTKKNKARQPKLVDPTAALPEKAFLASSPAGLSAAVTALVPRIANLLSGSPATLAVVAITVAKVLVYWTKSGDDSSLSPPSASAQTKTRRKKRTGNPESEDEEESLSDNKVDDKTQYDDAGQVIRRVKKPVQTPKLDNLERSKHSNNQGSGWLNSLVKKSSEKVGLPPSKMKLQDRLEDLSTRCEQAEMDKVNMEREYEKTSWELQETQIELNSLKASTRHLQAQITDNEEMLDRVVKTERRRAKDELRRIKEAMVKVVEEEREAMRAEFMKQAGELQMLWRKEHLPPPSGRPTTKRRYS